MIHPDSHEIYNTHVSGLKEQLGEEEALRSAIGGEFIAVGTLEYSLLLSLGLKDGQYVVDVGCGSGRLACQLAALPELRYAGFDVVPALLAYARKFSGRTDWRFEETVGSGIACADGEADFVCFFSLFTHLVHEETFRYLEEARRVLRPGGRIVFTFLEFRIPCHWEIFADSLAKAGTGQHLNQFMDREGIRLWAGKLGLECEVLADGDKPHIPISQPVAWDNGNVMKQLGNLGQSVAVLRVPPALTPSAPSAEAVAWAREKRIAELDALARAREQRILALDADRRRARSTWAWHLVRWEQILRKALKSATADRPPGNR